MCVSRAPSEAPMLLLVLPWNPLLLGSLPTLSHQPESFAALASSHFQPVWKWVRLKLNTPRPFNSHRHLPSLATPPVSSAPLTAHNWICYYTCLLQPIVYSSSKGLETFQVEHQGTRVVARRKRTQKLRTPLPALPDTTLPCGSSRVTSFVTNQ